MEECFETNYRAGVMGFDRSQTYGRPETTTTSNGDRSWIPSNIVVPHPFAMTCTKDVRRPPKRKYDQRVDFQPSYVENCLVQLCRGQKWTEVVHRCRLYPEEACLVPIFRENRVIQRSSYQRTTTPWNKRMVDASTPLFRETVLGILCTSKAIRTDEAKFAIQALVDANPAQVGVSQYIPGHTALREAILNSCCTIEIFKILTRATLRYSGGELALHLKDRNGLMPMDHLVTSVQLGSSLDSVAMLEEFLRVKQFVSNPSLDDHTSPLIRLLTMGNAPDRHNFSWGRRKKDEASLRLKRVLQATRLLLDNDPGILNRCSKVTNCTPLHVALRNYGNVASLIKELLTRDSSNKMIRSRNSYGDLPIHVACSVGVPLEVLELLVKKMIGASHHINSGSLDSGEKIAGCETHSLIWSVNNWGYTPVDLEWICHVESGRGSYTARTFSPPEETGVRQPCFMHDEYYRDVLRESVEQVMKCRDSSLIEDGAKCEYESRKEEAETVFGTLLDRISLLIRAAANSELSVGNCMETSTKLFQPCKLGRPFFPSLPLPILELYLWLRPGEVMEKDPNDFLPIHYVLRYEKTSGQGSSIPLSLKAVNAWKSFVFQLLDKSPEQCYVKSREGRLPLHYALDHLASSVPCCTTSETRSVLQSSRHAIVEKLIDLHPGSVDQKDPVTGLYPFMMASVDKSFSLNTVFSLLRRSPSRCPALTSIVKV